MRRTIMMLAALTAGLAACNEKAAEKSGEIAATDAMSQAQIKAQVDKVQLKPGQWEGRFTVQDIDMPGAPAGVKDQMKGVMNQTSLKYCVTPEEAANPSGKMFSGQENKNCTYSGFEAKDGAVKGHIQCKGEEGGTMNATMAGSYAPDNYMMDMDMKMGGAPQGMSMSMKARSEGKWIGPDCTQGK